MSFVFFFYNDTFTGFPRRANVGFAPSTSSGSRGESFMIPGVFTNGIELLNGSNTGAPGSYAFRVDLPIILQPGGIDVLISSLNNCYFISSHKQILAYDLNEILMLLVKVMSILKSVF